MHVSQLYIHPIKSAAAVEVARLEYEPLGPNFDRHWVIVDALGSFMSQRKNAKMCLLNVELNKQPERDLPILRLSAPEMPPFELAQASDQRVAVTVWNDHVSGRDCGDSVAAWLSDFLGRESRLIQLDELTQRQVDPDFAQRGELVGFADGFPTLVTTAASLAEFNSHLDTPVDMRRFRPNIVISDSDAYAEDNWRRIKIGDMVFDLVKPCSRCIMPSINPDTAAKEMVVNNALLKTRRGADGKTYFGQNALHRGVGQINVGDKVEVLESA